MNVLGESVRGMNFEDAVEETQWSSLMLILLSARVICSLRAKMQ
jgi:hypothetical protein